MSYPYTTSDNVTYFNNNSTGSPIIVVEGTPVEPRYPITTGYEPSNTNLTTMTSPGVFVSSVEDKRNIKMEEGGFGSTPYITSDRDHSGLGNTTERKFQDVPFAILFVAHLLLMGYACAVNSHKLYDSYLDQVNDTDYSSNRSLYGTSRFITARFLGQIESEAYDGEYEGQQYWHNGMFRAEQDGEDNKDVKESIYVALFLSFLLAGVFSSLSLSFMMHHSEGLIKTALIFNCVIYAIFGLLMLMGGIVGGALISLILFAVCACYTRAVWERIPFAAVNMKTAISAVKANIGVTVYAYIALILLLGWTLWWSITAITTLDLIQLNDQGAKDENGESEVVEVNGGLVFLLLVSYYWTHQVICNIVHVTIAGVVGTWWFAPADAGSCCSPATRDSFFRATTYSFGSICLGSLIVALLEAARDVVRNARESDDGILVCLADCCLGIIESLVEYFNRWAFIFVGLYGFSFVEAGKNAMTLFKTKGWTTIITDNLCERVLLLVSLGIGVFTGSLLDLFMVMSYGIGGDSSVLFMFFIIGFVVGLTWSSVLFGTISSAVATIIVCYAESPADFDKNHPALSNEMRSKWRQAWPIDFKY